MSTPETPSTLASLCCKAPIVETAAPPETWDHARFSNLTRHCSVCKKECEACPLSYVDVVKMWDDLCGSNAEGACLKIDLARMLRDHIHSLQEEKEKLTKERRELKSSLQSLVTIRNYIVARDGSKGFLANMLDWERAENILSTLS